MSSFSRRLLLKLAGAASLLLGVRKTAPAAPLPIAEPSTDPWHNTHDRVWLGPQFWANPMEDWRISRGAAECQSTAGNRNVHLLTHQLTDPAADFHLTVRVTQVEVGERDGGAGFRVGIKSDINEYKSNCFARSGINAGLVDGALVLGPQRQRLPAPLPVDGLTLHLHGRPDGDGYLLAVTAAQGDAQVLTLTHRVRPDAVLGNVALVNNFDPRLKRGQGARYRFQDWRATGDAFTVSKDHRFGPILWSMYTLSDSRGDEGFVLKLTALTGPLGADDERRVELQTQSAGDWISNGFARLDTDAWTATFRVANWDATSAAPYRLIYRERHPDGSQAESHWTGSIKANPAGRPLRLAALTCQKDYAFPYQPVVDNLLRLDPDLLYFSGDQLYEDHGGYGIIREPAERAILNYLRKFYMFGWAFREALRDCPTLCIPDDHDVFQGNIWGEGGAPMSGNNASSTGGYREPARMVNAVHRTCASHHPDYYDPKPCKQGISVYFGDMVYGNVGFAILGDRQFKSGPDRVQTGSGRADHVEDPDFDTSILDQAGLQLLGDRQEKFLAAWVRDGRGHDMKVLLSQTLFAGTATHHGQYDGYLKADLDSGGWPQTPRNRALRIIRKGMPLHICGDQHLTSLVQYGIDQQRDACWAFCTPAIAAGYPRWWRPDELGLPHTNRPAHGLPNTGQFLDGFGNRAFVYAVGNPEVASKKNRYRLAHQKGSGFGLVTIDTANRTYRIESFRFLVDATDGNPANQFPGWPLTIHQQENAGKNRI